MSRYQRNARNRAEWTELSRFPPPHVELCLVSLPRAGRVLEWAITQPIVRDDPWHHIDQLCIRAPTSARAFATVTCCEIPHAHPQVPQHFDGARAHGSLCSPQVALVSFPSYGTDQKTQGSELTWNSSRNRDFLNFCLVVPMLVPRHNSRFRVFRSTICWSR